MVFMGSFAMRMRGAVVALVVSASTIGAIASALLPRSAYADAAMDQIGAIFSTHTFWCFSDDSGYYRAEIHPSLLQGAAPHSGSINTTGYHNEAAHDPSYQGHFFGLGGNWFLEHTDDPSLVMWNRQSNWADHGAHWGTNSIIIPVNDPKYGQILGTCTRNPRRHWNTELILCDNGMIFEKRPIPFDQIKKPPAWIVKDYRGSTQGTASAQAAPHP